MSSSDDQENQTFDPSLQHEPTKLTRSEVTDPVGAQRTSLEANQSARQMPFPFHPDHEASGHYPSYWEEILEPRPFPPDYQHEQHRRPCKGTKTISQPNPALVVGSPCTQSNFTLQNLTDPTESTLQDVLAKIATGSEAQTDFLSASTASQGQNPFHDKPADGTTPRKPRSLLSPHYDNERCTDRRTENSPFWSHLSEPMIKYTTMPLKVAPTGNQGSRNAPTIAAHFTNTVQGCHFSRTLGSVVAPVSRSNSLPAQDTHEAIHGRVPLSCRQSDYCDDEEIKEKGDASNETLIVAHQYQNRQADTQVQEKQRELALKYSETDIGIDACSVLSHKPKAVTGDDGRATGSSGIEETPSPILGVPCTMIPPSTLVYVLATDEMAERNSTTIAEQASAFTVVAPKVGGNDTSSLYDRPSHVNKGYALCVESYRAKSPQQLLEAILKNRGYQGATRIKAEQALYDCAPSPLQLASYGIETFKAIHKQDITMLSKLLSAGLSPNACNVFRDGILDLAVEQSNYSVFKCLVSHGCDLRVCDGHGRTPLHHTCWASVFCKEIAETILQHDWHQWFIEDKQGRTPLEYVRKETANDWVEFLESNKGELFPPGKKYPPFTGFRERTEVASALGGTLQIAQAAALSSGKLKPGQVPACLGDS